MRLFRILLLSLVLIGVPNAFADMPVVDITAIARLREQLTKLMEQIQELQKVNQQLQEQINAIGRMGQISLPIVNATKMASRIRREVDCLKPDLSKLMPNVDFANADFGSVCEAAPAYRQALWVDPAELSKIPNWKDRAAKREEVEKRRERMLADSASKGIALADTAIKATEEQNKAADELATSAQAATSQNDRLAVIAQGSAVNARITAQTNQILAQLLHVQSLMALQMGVPTESLKDMGASANGGAQ